MKRLISLAAIALLPWIAHGSNGTSTVIEQPLNLGTKADPTRIPLAAVGVTCNYNYGLQTVVTAPRPLLFGTFETQAGNVLDANLASLFGVSAVPDDPTNVPFQPVAIKIAAWPAPKWSPYTRKQVVTATIHCLLRSVNATAKNPLQIRIEADDPAEAKELAELAGNYINPAVKDGQPSQATKIPGSRIEVDTRGLPWVIFGDSKEKGEAPEMPVPFAWIPYYTGGDSSGVEEFTLVPTIAGDNWNHDPLGMICRSNPSAHDMLSPLGGGVPRPEANALFGLGAVKWMEPRTNGQGGTTIHMELSAENGQDPLLGAFAATCHALVCTERPTVDEPLTIEVELGDEESLLSKALDEAEGWKRAGKAIRGNGSVSFAASFYWDPKHRCASGASTPGWQLSAGPSGAWMITPVSPPEEED